MVSRRRVLPSSEVVERATTKAVTRTCSLLDLLNRQRFKVAIMSQSAFIRVTIIERMDFYVCGGNLIAMASSYERQQYIAIIQTSDYVVRTSSHSNVDGSLIPFQPPLSTQPSAHPSAH
jgi:hypothetical protein